MQLGWQPGLAAGSTSADGRRADRRSAPAARFVGLEPASGAEGRGSLKRTPDCLMGEAVAACELAEALALGALDQLSPKLSRQAVTCRKRCHGDRINVGPAVGK